MTRQSSLRLAARRAWHPHADGDVVPIGDPEEDEGYGDDDDDEDDEEEEDEDEEPWQVAGARRAR